MHFEPLVQILGQVLIPWDRKSCRPMNTWYMHLFYAFLRLQNKHVTNRSETKSPCVYQNSALSPYMVHENAGT